MGEKVYRKDEKDGARDAGKNPATRITDAERGCHEDDHETRPRQRRAVGEMGPKWREQERRKISVEGEVIVQLRNAHVFRARICASQPERCFAPVMDDDLMRVLTAGDVT